MNVAVLEPDKVFPLDFKEGHLNTPDEVILDQVRHNIRLGLPQLQAYLPPPATIQNTMLLVCGGPSLSETEDELLNLYWQGAKVVAMNGSYEWCLEHRIKPSVMVMLDAREFNTRFVTRPAPGCKYLLASQCHPSAFEVCRGREIVLWHACSCGEIELQMLKDYYFDQVNPVTLGTTVALRTISIMRTLGFGSQIIFGLDSCWLGPAHHAYTQPENARDKRKRVWLRPKDRDDKAQMFECSPWMAKQCDDFFNLIRERGELFRLDVRGRGLIATAMRTAAEIQIEENS